MVRSWPSKWNWLIIFHRTLNIMPWLKQPLPFIHLGQESKHLEIYSDQTSPKTGPPTQVHLCAFPDKLETGVKASLSKHSKSSKKAHISRTFNTFSLVYLLESVVEKRPRAKSTHDYAFSLDYLTQLVPKNSKPK